MVKQIKGVQRLRENDSGDDDIVYRCAIFISSSAASRRYVDII